MAVISLTPFSWKKLCIFIPLSLSFVANAPIYNKSVLVQVMAWHRTGDKPLPEPMLAKFTDAVLGADESMHGWTTRDVL